MVRSTAVASTPHTAIAKRPAREFQNWFTRSDVTLTMCKLMQWSARTWVPMFKLAQSAIAPQARITVALQAPYKCMQHISGYVRFVDMRSDA